MRASQLFTIYSLLFALAILFRVALIPNPGFEADISFWKSWGLATYDKGIVEGMKVSNNNYPTPFAYTLGGMVFVYSLFADPHNFNQFWTNTNVLFLAVSKMLPILADLGIALLIVLIGKNTKRLGFPEIKISLFGLTFYELASLAYLLSPLSLIDGALWGQVDSVGVFIFLCSLLLALSKRPFLAGTIFMLAMMTKLQNMIYGPIFFLFIWQTLGFGGLIRAVAGATLGFFGLNIEFVLSRNMDRVLASLTENFDYFPWMSLNAYNLWWIVSGGRGMAVSDKLSVLGMLNAKTVGLVLFSASYLFAVLRQLFEKRPATPIKSLLEGLVIVNAAFFLFQSQSHDRYAFPLSVFLLLWAPFYLSVHTKAEALGVRFKLFVIFYLIFTGFYFYNLHTALIANYPNNGLPLLSTMTQPVFTIGTSYILLGLFAVFLFTLARSSRLTVNCLLLTVGVITTALFYLNKPLLTKQPIPLTRLTPFISEQSYGTRQTNRTVNSSFGGANGWTRLSVQYVFYKSGIGTHAKSRIVYDLNKKFQKFTTDYGIDTEAGSKASAVFEIYGDNTLLFRSQTMGRYMYPGHAEINISGVKHLTLITTDAGDSNFDDHTDWLNPVLWP